MKVAVEDAQQIGQKIIDLIADECDRLHTRDMNMVLNVLVSVLAHYIGGVEPLEARQAAYNQVGAWLAQHLTELVNRELPRAHVVTEREDLQ